MTILEENSKQLVDAIRALYLKGKYELEYAIVQLNKFYTNGRITKSDFEEQCEYFKSEKERLNTTEVAEENTGKAETVENATEDEIIEENKEVEKSAE